MCSLSPLTDFHFHQFVVGLAFQTDEETRANEDTLELWAFLNFKIIVS